MTVKILRPIYETFKKLSKGGKCLNQAFIIGGRELSGGGRETLPPSSAPGGGETMICLIIIAASFACATSCKCLQGKNVEGPSFN